MTSDAVYTGLTIEVQHFMYLNISIDLAELKKTFIEVQHFMYLNMSSLCVSAISLSIEVQHFMYLNTDIQATFGTGRQLKFNILCI